MVNPLHALERGHCITEAGPTQLHTFALAIALAIAPPKRDRRVLGLTIEPLRLQYAVAGPCLTGIAPIAGYCLCQPDRPAVV
ncbi:hypothetical protein D3C84_1015950 [compost metagenome]